MIVRTDVYVSTMFSSYAFLEVAVQQDVPSVMQWSAAAAEAICWFRTCTPVMMHSSYKPQAGARADRRLTPDGMTVSETLTAS